MSGESRLFASVYSPPKEPAGWRLEDFFAGCELRYFSYARHALTEALRACGTAAGDHVLMPEYICREVLASLHELGAVPVYYPLTPGLAPATPPSSWPAAKAVLAVDYFGFPQALAPFREYADRNGATLIEDGAHALLSRDEGGRPLGGRGDLGLLSIRKTLPIPNGGALVAPKGSRYALPPQEPFAPGRSRRFVAKQGYRALSGVVGARAGLLGLDLLRSARRAATGRRIPVSPPDGETRQAPATPPCAELGEKLRVGGPEAEPPRRRALYERLQALLVPAGAVPVFDRLPRRAVPYGFPYRAPGREDAVEAALASVGLSSLPWPELPDAVAPNAPAHYRDVRLAHFLW